MQGVNKGLNTKLVISIYIFQFEG